MQKPVRCLSGETTHFVALMKIAYIQILYIFYFFFKLELAITSAAFFLPLSPCDRMALRSHHSQPHSVEEATVVNTRSFKG